jgi:hypothetical protein
MDLIYLVQEPQLGKGKDEERARPTGEKGVGSVDVGGEKVAVADVVITVGGDVPRRQAVTSRRHLAPSRRRLVPSRAAPPHLLTYVSRLAEAIQRCHGGDEIQADLGRKGRSSPVSFPGRLKPNSDFLLDLVLQRAVMIRLK